MLLTLVTILLQFTHAYSQINLADCGTKFGCFRKPVDCTSPATCDAIATYKFNTTTQMVMFELITTKRWIALGMKPAPDSRNIMVSLNGQYCLRNDAGATVLRNFNGNNLDINSQPDFQVVVQGVTLLGTNNADGTISCRFQRSVAPDASNSQFLYNLNQQLIVAIAHGIVARGDIPGYHGNGNTTFNEMNVFTAAQVKEPDITCSNPSTCVRMPTSCTDGSDCNLLVNYQRDQAKHLLEVTISSKKSWGSFTQVPNLGASRMAGIRGEICHLNGSMVALQSLTVPGITNTRPVFTALANGVTSIRSFRTKSGAIVCQYTRTINVTAASANQLYNLETPHHIVYAAGDVSGTTINYHGFGTDHRAFSASPVAFIPLPPSNRKVNLAECGLKFGCFRSPVDCTNVSQCNAVVTYAVNTTSQTVEFEIITSKTWAALGRKMMGIDEPTMIKLNGQFCLRGDLAPILGNFHGNNLKANGQPEWKSNVQGVTLLGSTNNADGTISCRFTTPIAPSASNSEYLYDLKNTLTGAIAFGTNKSGNLPSYHMPQNYIVANINFLNVTAAPVIKVPEITCAGNVGCIRLPNNCNSSRDCNLLITYIRNRFTGRLDVTIASSNIHQWGSFAVVPKLSGDKMAGIRGEICYLNNSMVGLQSLTVPGNRNTRPTFQNLVEGVTLLQGYRTSSGAVVCKYTRTITVTAASANQLYNLETPHHIVYAAGTVSGTTINYHGRARAATAGPVTFVEKTTPAPTATDPPDDGFVAGCNKRYGCLLKPEGCTSVTTCDAVAAYIFNSDSRTVDIALFTKSTWVGLGQRPDSLTTRLMNRLNGHFCLRDGSTPISGHFDGRGISTVGKPAWLTNVANVTVLARVNNRDGTISCRFRRPVSVNDPNSILYDMNNALRAVIADGTDRDGDNPGFHGRRNYLSFTSVNFLTVAAAQTEKIPIDGKVKAHGILMIIAWMLLATFGIYMPRYMKTVLKDKKIMGKSAWFPIHQFTMITVVLTFITGLILILVHLDGEWAEGAGTHHWLGLFTIIAGLIQPLMAIFRPDPDADSRFIFNWLHRFMGFLAWVLGGVAIVYGLDLIKEDYAAAIVFVCAVPALGILLDIILLISGSKKSSVPVSYDADDGVGVGKNSSREKGSGFQWLFLLLIVALAIAMTIYHIYIVADA